MKKLNVSLSICLLIISITVQSQTSLTNDWNAFTIHPYNWIVDSKVNPNDGIYTIEKNVVLVPYIQGSDTLYGTQDSCTYLKKFSLQGTLVWSISFPTVTTFNGTVGEPGKIKVLSDGMLLLCNWGVVKYTFGGTQVFTTVYPQSSFDSYGFFGGGPDQDYFWDDVYQSNGMTLTMGHLNHCDSVGCYTTNYIFSWINAAGAIVDTLSINRNAEMHFAQKNGSLYFAYIANGSIMIERADLTTKVVSLVMNCFYAPGPWDINKLITLHKTTNGFRLVTSNVKDWDYNYNSTHPPTNYFAEVDTITNSMLMDTYTQNNTKLKPCADERTSTVQVGDTIYVSTEDAKLIKWGNSHQMNVVDVLGSQEKICGTARITLFGHNLIYVTNDSILTTIDSIVGNVTYTTEHKASVIRVLDKNLNVLAKDTLADYAIDQFDLNTIDSTSFVFGGWWYTHPSVLSKWSFVEQITTGINEQPINKQTDLKVYPNPFTSDIHITITQPSIVTIYDITGSKIYSEYVQTTTNINLDYLSKGLYFIQTSDGKTEKIIK